MLGIDSSVFPTVFLALLPNNWVNPQAEIGHWTVHKFRENNRFRLMSVSMTLYSAGRDRLMPVATVLSLDSIDAQFHTSTTDSF